MLILSDYPWSTWSTDASTDKKFESLRLWLVLPDYVKPPDIRYLMGKLINLAYMHCILVYIWLVPQLGELGW